MLAAVGGGFMKPVIMGTVVRTRPRAGRPRLRRLLPHDQRRQRRRKDDRVRHSLGLVGIRYVMIISVRREPAALGIAIFRYKEPSDGSGRTKAGTARRRAAGLRRRR